MIEGPNGQVPADNSLTREQYLAINPTGFVPALVIHHSNNNNANIDDDDTSRPSTMTTLTELSAILIYISTTAAETLHKRSLTGQTPLTHAQVCEWMSYLSVALNEYGFCGLRRPSRLVGPDASPPALAAARAQGLASVRQGFAWIEARLEHNLLASGLLVPVRGEACTVVDFMLHTFWRWGVMAQDMGVDMQLYPHFEAHVRQTEKLDSVRATLGVEGVGLNFPDASP